MPKGIVLVHVKDTGYTYGSVACFRSFPVEQQSIFVSIYVLSGFFAFPPIGENSFAFVSREERITVGEGIAAYETFVFTAVALNLSAGISGSFELLVYRARIRFLRSGQ